MEVAIIGGDLRFAYLTQLLRDHGLDARAVALERAELPGLCRDKLDAIGEAEYLVLNSPVRPTLAPRPVDLESVLAQAGQGARLIFAGPEPAPALPTDSFSSWDLSINETFLRQNAGLTAEAALVAAAAKMPDSLADVRTLVIGWGRIGRALTERLVALGGAVTVASRSARSRSQAQARGASAIDTARLVEVLDAVDLIFSTPPALVLDAELLARIPAGAYIVDLASPPYGVDLEAANALGLNAWREPGLPGRYCPRSAARVLARYVTAIIEQERGERHG